MVDANLTVTETITLTREEVEEAREEWIRSGDYCRSFLSFPEHCRSAPERYAYCRLCKKLTQFVEGGEE